MRYPSPRLGTSHWGLPAGHPAAGCALLRTGIPQHCALQRSVPSLPAFGDISGRAGLRSGLHHSGKCSAERLPALMQCPDIAALGVVLVSSFTSSLPNSPRGLHRWQSPSSLSLCGLAQGSAWLPCRWTHPAGTSLGVGCRQDHSSDVFCQPLFVPKTGLICPLPEKSVPGILAQVPACCLPQLVTGNTLTSLVHHL